MTLEHLLAIGTWTTTPEAAALDGDGCLVVTAREGSDAWRTTSYGFVHDTEHALVVPFGAEQAIEVSFALDYTEQFDQAGVFLRTSPTIWIKAGIEISDGVPQAGAVVTDGLSDWSVSPVPEWVGEIVTIRASRSGDAVTIRARAGDGPFRLLRVAPLDPSATVQAGLYCCAPTRAGLTVRFTDCSFGPPDASLHP